MTDSADTQTRYPLPGDRTRLNLPGTPLHHRDGTITTLGPYAVSVALDGEHGDERVFRHSELDFPDDAPDDPIIDALTTLREYVAKWAAFRSGDGDTDPGDPPVVAMLVACGDIERLREECGEPIIVGVSPR